MSSAFLSGGRTPPRQTNTGTQDETFKTEPKQEYKIKPGIRLGTGGDPGDNGNEPSSWEDDNFIPPKEDWNRNSDY